jgi:hypothetical protein
MQIGTCRRLCESHALWYQTLAAMNSGDASWLVPVCQGAGQACVHALEGFSGVSSMCVVCASLPLPTDLQAGTRGGTVKS